MLRECARVSDIAARKLPSKRQLRDPSGRVNAQFTRLTNQLFMAELNSRESHSTSLKLEENDMSFELTELVEGKIIEVRISGKLTKEAYLEFVPVTEAAIKKHGKVRILFIMHDFHGWDAGAMWADIKFDLKHFNHIERLGIVGETKWEQGMSFFCRPFTTAKIKYFDSKDLEAARAWIAESVSP
jgi:hypothetical protein